jgi:hypothetical protein
MNSHREAAVASAVCAAAVLVKLALIFTSQRSLDGDEAILGLMAMHVQQGVSHPLFFYGQAYDAGAGILAHLAALVFQIGGVSVLALKFVGLAVWLSMTAVAFAVARMWFGWRAAAISAMLILWAPTSIEWAMKARGGQMLAVVFSVMTLGLVLRATPEREYRLFAAAGAAGAAAVWIHPSTLPVIAVVLLWVLVELALARQGSRFAFVFLGAAVVSIMPLVALQTASTAWSWQAFTVADTHRDPRFLFGSVLPALFTPEVDWSIPPPPSWIKAVGYVWLAVFAASCVYVARRLRRGAGLLLATTLASMGAMFMVDTQTVTARTLLPLYPLACIAIAVAVDLSKRGVVMLLLLLPAIAVHAASFGPAEIHGAGEQARRLPSSAVAAMVADLDRQGVRCVFSESPMLQWNLMFDSRERIAARWVTPVDRWQPYVERVNAAFARGDRCALLVRRHDGYGLVYDPPSKLIVEAFKVAF